MRGQAILPPLSRDEQKEVLEFLASNCQILHDAFLEVPQLADTQKATAGLSEEHANRLHMATEAACDNLPFALVDKNGNIRLNVKASEDEAFWEVQRDMNAISSNPMTADDALDFLFRNDEVDCDAVKQHGRGMVNPLVLESARRADSSLGERMTLTPKPWQIVGAAWLGKMDATMFAGGILANGCGTGKTNTTHPGESDEDEAS